MSPRYRYHIRWAERLEVREGDEMELVTWPVLDVYFHSGGGRAALCDYIADGGDVVREIAGLEPQL